MTNKREFFFIVFLCAVSMVIFYAGKDIPMRANALNSISNPLQDNSGREMDPAEQKDLEEGDWEGVPSADIQDEAEIVELPGSASSEIQAEKNDAADLESNSAQEDRPENYGNSGSNKEPASQNKIYADYNPESEKAPAQNSIKAAVKISDHQIREKQEVQSALKIQEEKGTVYQANKSAEEASGNSAAALKAAEPKIELSKKEEIKRVEPLIADTLKTAQNSANQEASSGQENQNPSISKSAAPAVKKISIADKSDIASLRVEAVSSEAGKKDSNGDGIPDEIKLKLGLDPEKADSDGDGFSDGLEISLGYNPAGAGILAKTDIALIKSPQLKNSVGEILIVDSDNDGILDRVEIIIGTDLFNPDSDGDGYSDGEEFSKGFNPLKSADSGDDAIALEDPEESEAPVDESLAVENVVRRHDKDEDGAVLSEQIVLSGKADPGSFIAVYVFSDPIADMVQADSAGEWVYIVSKALSLGEHTAYSAIVDSAGLIVAKSNPVKFLIEEIEAAPSVFSEIGAENAVAVPIWKSSEFYIAAGIAAVILGIIGFMIVKEISY